MVTTVPSFAQKWGILSFQHIFLFSFLQLHKRVSMKILQKRITEIHSEFTTRILQLVNFRVAFLRKKLRFSNSYRDFQELLKLEQKREAISRKTKKDEIFRNSGGRKAESRNSELLHSNIDILKPRSLF